MLITQVNLNPVKPAQLEIVDYIPLVPCAVVNRIRV